MENITLALGSVKKTVFAISCIRLVVGETMTTQHGGVRGHGMVCQDPVHPTVHGTFNGDQRLSLATCPTRSSGHPDVVHPEPLSRRCIAMLTQGRRVTYIVGCHYSTAPSLAAARMQPMRIGNGVGYLYRLVREDVPTTHAYILSLPVRRIW